MWSTHIKYEGLVQQCEATQMMFRTIFSARNAAICLQWTSCWGRRQRWLVCMTWPRQTESQISSVMYHDIMLGVFICFKMAVTLRLRHRGWFHCLFGISFYGIPRGSPRCPHQRLRCRWRCSWNPRRSQKRRQSLALSRSWVVMHDCYPCIQMYEKKDGMDMHGILMMIMEWYDNKNDT